MIGKSTYLAHVASQVPKLKTISLHSPANLRPQGRKSIQDCFAYITCPSLRSFVPYDLDTDVRLLIRQLKIFQIDELVLGFYEAEASTVEILEPLQRQPSLRAFHVTSIATQRIATSLHIMRENAIGWEPERLCFSN